MTVFLQIFHTGTFDVVDKAIPIFNIQKLRCETHGKQMTASNSLVSRKLIEKC